MIGLCLADPDPVEISDGGGRTQAAIHFACRYRLVDFMLSNMVNSGVHTIAILLNSQFQNIITHVKNGIEWDLSRKTGGAIFFPPYLTDDRRLPYSSDRDDALQRALATLQKLASEHLLVTSCGHTINIDYRCVLAAHEKSGADITAVYVEKPLAEMDVKYALTLELGRDGRVSGARAAESGVQTQNVSVGAYLMSKTTLLQLLAGRKTCDMRAFTLGVLPGAARTLRVMAYRHEGYSAGIYSFETFFRYNMDMLDREKFSALLLNAGRRVYTNVRDSLPPVYGGEAKVKNVIAADGCVLEGRVENCVLFRNVTVKRGATVKNSVLQSGVTVERGASLEYICADTDVIVTERKRLYGSAAFPVYIPAARVI